MGAMCCSNKAKFMNIDTFWEMLNIRHMSMIEFKKKFFAFNSSDLKDLKNFETFFIKEEFLIQGDSTLLKLYREMFMDYAKKTDIMKLIFILLFLCRNDESIDKTIVLTEMNKLLNLKLIFETTEHNLYVSKESYHELLAIYVNLISEFSVSYVKKLSFARVEINIDKMFSKNIQDKLIDERVNSIAEDDKVYLKNIVKSDWSYFSDDSRVRNTLTQLYLNPSCNIIPTLGAYYESELAVNK
jgi:hypothetical protein